MIEVRTLVTSLGFEHDGELVSLDGVFSRLRSTPEQFAVYAELVKQPFVAGIGIDFRLSRAGTEVWRWGEELIELVAGDVIVVIAALAEGLRVAKGSYLLELLLESEVVAERMLYLGSSRGQK